MKIAKTESIYFLLTNDSKYAINIISGDLWLSCLLAARYTNNC